MTLAKQWQKRENDNIVVEAVRVNEENVDEVVAWCGGVAVTEIDPEHPEETQTGINIRTPTGMKRASLGTYVVRYGGNFFTTSVRQFEIVYEPVAGQAPPPESAGDTRKRLGFGDAMGSQI